MQVDTLSATQAAPEPYEPATEDHGWNAWFAEATVDQIIEYKQSTEADQSLDWLGKN